MDADSYNGCCKCVPDTDEVAILLHMFMHAHAHTHIHTSSDQTDNFKLQEFKKCSNLAIESLPKHRLVFYIINQNLFQCYYIKHFNFQQLLCVTKCIACPRKLSLSTARCLYVYIFLCAYVGRHELELRLCPAALGREL